MLKSGWSWFVRWFLSLPVLFPSLGRTIPSAPITIGKTVTLRLYKVISSLTWLNFLTLFLFSLIFTLWFDETVKSTSFLVVNYQWPEFCDFFVSQNQWKLYASHSPRWILIIIIIIIITFRVQDFHTAFVAFSRTVMIAIITDVNSYFGCILSTTLIVTYYESVYCLSH